MTIKIVALLSAGLFIASCSDAISVPQADNENHGAAEAISADAYSPPPTPKRVIDSVKVARGKELYLVHCMSCHGGNAKGGKLDWRKKGEDGKYPPPPLNGEGHAWHHPMKVLREFIKEGGGKYGGNMKGFKDKLDDADVDNVILWIQSKWPDEQYTAWYWRDKGAREREKNPNLNPFTNK